jgi:hypothetical protein
MQNNEFDLSNTIFFNRKNFKSFKIESSIYFVNSKVIKRKLIQACGFDSIEELFESQRVFVQEKCNIKDNPDTDEVK